MLKLPLLRERVRRGFESNPFAAYGYSVVGVCAALWELLAPTKGADLPQFPLLCSSHLPAASARHSLARGGPEPASKSLTIRLQLTTMQVISTWIVTFAKLQ